MKKTLLLFLFLPLSTLLAVEPCRARPAAPRFSLGAQAGVRVFSSDAVKKIYGSSCPAFGLDLGLLLGRRLEVFIAGERLSSQGELSHTRETTTLSLLALEAGGRYLFGRGSLVPYTGAGAGYYAVKEENVIGVLDEKKAGFFALAGLRWRIARSLFASLQMKYVSLSLSANDRSQAQGVELGGVFASGGIGFSF